MLGLRVSRMLGLCALAAWVSPDVVRPQPVPLGPEFQVNQYTTGNQANAAVAVDGDGGFVVVWDSYQDGAYRGIVARLFDDEGAPLGDEFLVNSHTTQDQSVPRVARRANGDFVVVWQSAFQDGDNAGIFAQRFNAAGDPQGDEFRVNAITTGQQAAPAVAMQSDGRFIVTWQGPDLSNVGVFARHFDAAGGALTSDFQVNTFTTNGQQAPGIFVDGGDGFVVAWSSDGQDGSSFGSFARRHNSSAVALTPDEFRLNAFTTGSQPNPSIAFGPDGGFVATWGSVNTMGADQDGSDAGLFGRRFDSASQPVGDEFQVNAYTTGNQILSTVLAGGQGSFVVVWYNYVPYPGVDDVFTRSFNGLSQPRSGDVRVNTLSVGENRQPRAAGSAQRYVVVWQTTNNGDDSNFGVAGRLYESLVLLDVDGNGEVDPLTDGLLLIRYIFGFRNQELIENAIGPGCTRCDAPSIEAFLGAL